MKLLRLVLLFIAGSFHVQDSSEAAIVSYNLTGAGLSGTVASGSFSYDSAVVTPDYSSTSALNDLTTFSVTLTSIGGGVATTTFTKANTQNSFYMVLDSGNITDFNPGFSANVDGYSLSAVGLNQGQLDPGAVDTITWSYTAVPEPSTYATVFALGSLAFAAYRRPRGV